MRRPGCIGVVALVLGFIALTFFSDLFNGFWNILIMVVALWVFGLIVAANKKLQVALAVLVVAGVAMLVFG